MNEFIWSYASNTFEVSTRNSAKKMIILGPDHKSKLAAASSDPDIAAINIETQAPLQDFTYKYSHWMAANGSYKGETNRVSNLFIQLSRLSIKQWDAQIQAEYLEGTSDYISLLPQGRKPFQSGAYDIRLTEIASLSSRLLRYPSLLDLQVTVANYYTMLLAARDLQQQKEGEVKKASNELNTSRIALAVQMYKNLAVLMAKYCHNPAKVQLFYDLSLLRRHSTSSKNNNKEDSTTESSNIVLDNHTELNTD